MESLGHIARQTEFFVVADPDDVELAVALFEFVQEVFDSMDGVQKLEPVCEYKIISCKSPTRVESA